jgi:hypothetical protein
MVVDVRAATVIALSPLARYGRMVVAASRRSIRSVEPTLTVRSLLSMVTVVLAGMTSEVVHRPLESVAVWELLCVLVIVIVGYAE